MLNEGLWVCPNKPEILACHEKMKTDDHVVKLNGTVTASMKWHEESTLVRYSVVSSEILNMQDVLNLRS